MENIICTLVDVPVLMCAGSTIQNFYGIHKSKRIRQIQIKEKWLNVSIVNFNLTEYFWGIESSCTDGDFCFINSTHKKYVLSGEFYFNPKANYTFVIIKTCGEESHCKTSSRN